MSRPERLSQGFIKGIAERGRYGDGHGSHGLSLLVKPRMGGGLSKTWAQRLPDKSSIGLGLWPEVSVEEARARALDNWRTSREGEALPRRQQVPVAFGGVPTFAELSEVVIRERSQAWKDAKTADLWRARLGEYAHPIASMPVDEVSAGDVRRCVARIWTTRHATALKTLQYISSVFDRAIVEDSRTDNPAARVAVSMPKVKRVVQHHAALAAREIPDALDKVRGSNATPQVKDIFEFIVLTAARSGEARGARWDEVDLDLRVWTIPGSRMKSGREHKVPLSMQTMNVLHRAREYAGRSGLLFPSPSGKAIGHATLPKMLRELGIPATTHGGRASFRTWAAEHDVLREIAEMCLAHELGSKTETSYMRSDHFNARIGVMQQWADVVVPEPDAF